MRGRDIERRLINAQNASVLHRASDALLFCNFIYFALEMSLGFPVRMPTCCIFMRSAPKIARVPGPNAASALEIYPHYLRPIKVFCKMFSFFVFSVSRTQNDVIRGIA